MSDIVEKLHKDICDLEAAGCSEGWIPDHFREAAAELARLRAELFEAQQDRDTAIVQRAAERLAALIAERDRDAAKAEAERLREALARLEAMVRILPPEMDEPGSALAQARAALQEKPHD